MPLRFKEVSFTYSPGTPFAYDALKNINLTLKEGKMTAIIGNTGSGKSTLIQHLNALLLPTKGEVEVGEFNIVAGTKLTQAKQLRKKVGLVFQFPEYQLFEDTVLKDVMFGPLNFGVAPVEAEAKSKAMLKLVGLGEKFYEKSPLELSGGEKRKVAIAGILAMEPEVLVLDEPVAGLDPQSAKHMMELFTVLNKKYNKTVLIVTHNMEHVLNYCDEVIVVKNGEIISESNVRDFFKKDEILDDLHIAPPMIIQAKRFLRQKGIDISDSVLTIDELADAIKKAVR